MKAILSKDLVVGEPGAYRPVLLRLATFRRRGRVPTGQQRVIRAYRNEVSRVVIPRGLLFRARREAPLDIHDRRLRFEPRSFRWTGRLYPYQAAAVSAIYRQQGGVLVSAPGSGKTVMGLSLAAAWGQPTLWLTHTTRLAEQALSQAHRLFNLPPSSFGFVGDGSASIGSHFTVAMIQTLMKRPDIEKTLVGRFGALIVDECHHAPADTYFRVISQFPAAYRLGLSATPDRTDGLGPLMVAMLGGRVAVPLRVLLEAGRVMRPLVLIQETSLRIHGQNRGWAEIERIRAHDLSRNAIILSIIRELTRLGRRTLVLVTRKDHARILAKALTKTGLQAFAVIGDLTPERRDRYLAEMERGQAVCVATRLADEGLDIPALDALVLASAARSTVQLDQQIGRVMRTMEGKRRPLVVDIADPHVPTYRRQVRKRLQHYGQLGLEVRGVRQRESREA